MKKQKNNVVIIGVLLVLIAVSALWFFRANRSSYSTEYIEFPSDYIASEEVALDQANRLAFEEKLEEAKARLDSPDTPEERIPDVHITIGSLYETFGDYDSALESYLTAEDLRPDSSPIMVTISRLQYRRGDYDAALDYAERAVATEAYNPVAYEWRAELEEKLLVDPRGAFPVYVELMEKSNYDQTLVDRLIQHLERTEQYDEALTWISQVQDLYGDSDRYADWAERILRQYRKQ